jgi:tetratricopeptide (TPR) repeat protein
MREVIIQRASVLFEQRRYEEAEKMLSEVLQQNPEDVMVLAMLAEVNLELDKTTAAETLINTAIGIAPDYANLFYVKTRVLIQLNKYDDAEKTIETAIQLQPDDADYYAYWASIKLHRKQYDQALELADRALALDPENLLGLNIRSNALVKLNRKDESFQTIEGALRNDPNSAYTHANYGWNLLEKGNHKKALEHFREALKNDPNNRYAQSGMVAALKANNILYRGFLKYAFFLGKLQAKFQWAFIIGFYIAVRIISTIADNNVALQPYLNPIIILLAIFAFSTWVMTPVSNLLFRLNPYGKHLLDENEIKSSNFVGLSFVVFLLGVIAYFITGSDLFLPIAVFGFTMMVPFSVMFSPSKYKNAFLIYAMVMAAVGIAAIYLIFDNQKIGNPLVTVYLIGFIAFQWIANFIRIREDNV